MTTIAINPNQPLFQQPSVPYITNTEYVNAPTSVDVSELVVGGTTAQESQELSRVIARACAVIDNWLNQTLTATSQTAVQIARVKEDGTVTLRIDNSPILELTAASFQTDLMDPNPANYTALDCSKALINRQTVTLGYTAGLTLSPGVKARFQTTVVAGYPNTTLSVAATAGASSITVANALGLYTGSQMAFFDDTGGYEQCVVSGMPVGNVVSLASPLQFAHGVGVAFSGLPESIKEAAILVTNVLIRTRGSEALVLGSLTGVPSVQKGDPANATDLTIAKSILSDFKRVWT